MDGLIATIARRSRDWKADTWGFIPWLLLGNIFSVAQSRPFDLLIFPFLSSFSHGPKRLPFYSWVLWASEFYIFAYCGLEVEIPFHLTARIFDYFCSPNPTSNKIHGAWLGVQPVATRFRPFNFRGFGLRFLPAPIPSQTKHSQSFLRRNLGLLSPRPFRHPVKRA